MTNDARADPGSITLVLPAWNEAEGIEHGLDEARAALGALARAGAIGAYEVVVVDDGSTDRTAAVVAEVAVHHPEVRLVVHDRNRGVGAGLRTGLAAATGTYFVSTDADLPVDLAAIGPALERLRSGEVDLVAGSRTRRRDDGLVRWVCTAGYDRVVSMAFGVPVDDVNFAFKVASTALLRSMELRSEGPFIDAELVATAILTGHRVEVVPMTYQPRRFGESSTLTPRTLARLGREFVALAPGIRRLRRLPHAPGGVRGTGTG